jgi:hypothetical protein
VGVILRNMQVTDSWIKEAIVCAMAESTFSTYVLDERYRTVKAA